MTKGERRELTNRKVRSLKGKSGSITAQPKWHYVTDSEAVTSQVHVTLC